MWEEQELAGDIVDYTYRNMPPIPTNLASLSSDHACTCACAYTCAPLRYAGTGTHFGTRLECRRYGFCLLAASLVQLRYDLGGL